jgi:hypothetical protein
MEIRNAVRPLAGLLGAGALITTLAFSLDAQSGPPTLTEMDYIEIQQLVARYSFALDNGADNGYMYADQFLPDGIFLKSQGREELAKLARGPRRGPLMIRNMASLAIIKPSPEGATGIQYAQAINFGERDKGTVTELDHYGHYEDVYVKTPAGWRIKSRRYVNLSGGLKARPQSTATTAPPAQPR